LETNGKHGKSHHEGTKNTKKNSNPQTKGQPLKVFAAVRRINGIVSINFNVAMLKQDVRRVIRRARPSHFVLFAFLRVLRVFVVRSVILRNLKNVKG